MGVVHEKSFRENRVPLEFRARGLELRVSGLGFSVPVGVGGERGSEDSFPNLHSSHNLNA